MSESTSSREEHVGEVVFSRTGGIGDQADDWDDTSLVEAYDAALGGILDKLDKRKQCTSSQRASTSAQPSTSTQAKWKRGDFCRAQYSADNQWYEGRILAVDGGYCIVEYIGYKNHERQPSKSLRPSGGQKQRLVQIRAAELDEGGDSDASRAEELSAADNVSVKSGRSSSTRKGSQDESSKSQHQRQQQQLEHLLNLQEQHQRYGPDDEHQQKTVPKGTQKTKDSSRKRGAHEPSMPSMIAFPPPPPPFPPGVDEICDGDEALAAMLISWYISGYHTGYYTAVRKNSNR